MLAVALLLLVCSLVFTWPLALGFGSLVHDHDDPLFSLWRLGWVAHALATNPGGLFHANVFSPRRTP